jgi:hypothetical protein
MECYSDIKAMRYMDNLRMSMGMMNGFDGVAGPEAMTKCAGGGL